MLIPNSKLIINVAALAVFLYDLMMTLDISSLLGPRCTCRPSANSSIDGAENERSVALHCSIFNLKNTAIFEVGRGSCLMPDFFSLVVPRPLGYSAPRALFTFRGVDEEYIIDEASTAFGDPPALTSSHTDPPPWVWHIVYGTLDRPISDRKTMAGKTRAGKRRRRQ